MTRLGRTAWNRSISIFCLSWFLLSSSRSLAGPEAPVLPTPQFHQFLEGELTLPKGAVEVVFVLPARIEPSIKLATQLILQGLKEAGIEAKVVERKAWQALTKSGFNVILLCLHRMARLNTVPLEQEGRRSSSVIPPIGFRRS